MRKHGMFWKSEHTKKEKKEIINENIFLYDLVLFFISRLIRTVPFLPYLRNFGD